MDPEKISLTNMPPGPTVIAFLEVEDTVDATLAAL